MKILVAVPGNLEFGSKPNNGVSVFARNISLELHRRYGHEITFVVRMQPDEVKENWYDLVEIPDKRTHIVWLIDKLLELSGDYDLIQVHSSFYCMSMMAYRATNFEDGQGFKCPVTLMLHSPWMAGITTNDYKARSSVDQMDKLFHLSFLLERTPNMIEEYYKEELGGRKLDYTLLPTISDVDVGFDVEAIHRVNRVLIVTRLDPVKNVVNNLSKAIADVKKYPGFVIDLVLSTKTVNSMTKSLERLTDEVYKLIADNEGLVQHHERLSREELAVKLAQSKLLYHFSDCRSVDLVPMEANQFGTPVVGYRDVIRHVDYPGNFLIDYDDAPGRLVLERTPNFLEKALEFNDGSDGGRDDYDALRLEFRKAHHPKVIAKVWNEYYEKIVNA